MVRAPGEDADLARAAGALAARRRHAGAGPVDRVEHRLVGADGDRPSGVCQDDLELAGRRGAADRGRGANRSTWTDEPLRGAPSSSTAASSASGPQQ